MSPDLFLNEQAYRRATHHGRITQAQRNHVPRKEGIHLDSQRIACLFDVPQARGDDHDGQTNPEEHEEAPEVTIVALRIEVRDPRPVVDVVERTIFGFGSSILPRGRDG